MSNYNKLFTYPEENADIEIWQSPLTKNFNIAIEAYILYPTLQKAVDYLTSLNQKYYDWLMKHYDMQYLKASSYSLNRLQPDYKTYDIEITAFNGEDLIGYMIVLNAPEFSNLYDTYAWLEGVIIQIKTKIN